MNEDIKKEFYEKFKEIEQLDEHMVKVRPARDDIWQWIESKLEEERRKAIKDFCDFDLSTDLYDLVEKVRSYQWDMDNTPDDEARAAESIIADFLKRYI